MAWVTCDQIAPVTGDGMDIAGLSRELRILERHDGEWKFACLCFFQRSLTHLHAAVVQVDADARVRWQSPAAETELADSATLVIRAGRLRAIDKGADGRLQGLIRWAAHLDDGLYAAQAALPVVLDGGDGPADVCWVVGQSGYVLVAINDAGMSEQRLTAAALVYGLTPAQTRVARMIVGGHDIVTAARLLKISVNTARTHLQRMYDRTGVRSQPTLVRALLSVSPPIG